MTGEARRDAVRIGIDFRAIPVDLGDGIEWEFTSDPDPHQWAGLVEALKGFTKFDDSAFGGEAFKEALSTLSHAMSKFIVKAEQQAQWIEKQYGLGPQQKVSEALMEMWTGFPTSPPSPSGKGSRATGSR